MNQFATLKFWEHLTQYSLPYTLNEHEEYIMYLFNFHYNIKINLKEIRPENVDWIHLTQSYNKWWAYLERVMNFQFVMKEENVWSSSATVIFSKGHCYTQLCLYDSSGASIARTV
jgi:hypothetical protein